MPGHQRQCPDTSSENEKGRVHCRHIPSCTKWMSRHTRNKHWRTMLHNEACAAQGKFMIFVRVSTLIHGSFFCQLWMPVMLTMRIPAVRPRSLLLTFLKRVLTVRNLLLTLPMRVSAVRSTATTHAIIHLPTDLWNCGPAWAHWAFVME